MKRLLKLIQRSIAGDKFVKQSYSVVNEKVWHEYTSDPEFPYLISFPRTGSHWLRNVMELYFEKPSLTRVFFYKKPKGYTCFHIHDEDLSFNEKKRIIYLFRDPVETIFSQMNYYNENIKDENRVRFWTIKYGRHLEKWLLKDELSTDKVVLTYEGLKTNFNQEFKKLCDFLNVPFEVNKLKYVHEKTSKEKIKKRVTDDPRVINSSNDYDSNRNWFIRNHTKIVKDILKEINPKLNQVINS